MQNVRMTAAFSKILLQKPDFAFRIGGAAGPRPSRKSILKPSASQMNAPATLEADLLYEVRDGIGRVTFNRPQARNSLTFSMYEQLAEICESARKDTALKVLILTGAGDKAFASGTDINQFRAFKTPDDAIGYETRIDRILGTLEQCQVPIIAAINGVCVGGGAGIAACCDIRIGTKSAKFGFPIARTLGNCLSMSNLGRLSTLIGAARLKEIIFTARLIEAEEAFRIGLLNEVVEDLSALERRADELARLVAGHAPLTLRATKQALLRMQPKVSEDEELILMCYQSRDFREGMDAFLNKRQPQWTGE
jgi:enoyl-CoA hydratase/carnithine racemase